jgi:hypothetical protein
LIKHNYISLFLPLDEVRIKRTWQESLPGAIAQSIVVKRSGNEALHLALVMI